MRKKQEIFLDLAKSNFQGQEDRLNLEIQIDIRDQLERIADNLEPQITSQEVKTPEPIIPK